MPRVLVLGAGKIGSLVACLLSEQGSYEIHLADVTPDAPKHFVEDLGLARVTPTVLDVRVPETVATYLSAHPVDAICLTGQGDASDLGAAIGFDGKDRSACCLIGGNFGGDPADSLDQPWLPKSLEQRMNIGPV